MIAAIERLKSYAAPPAPTSQTVVVGTESARAAFQPALSGVLHVHQNAIVADLHMLAAVYQLPTWRYIAIVNTAAELYTITKHVSVTSDRLAIIGVECSVPEGVNLRVAAMRELGGAGIMLVGGGTRALDTYGRLVRAWRANADEGAVRRVWGDASLASTGDVVVPPGWDTEGKIRAVVDAVGLDFDEIVSSSSWGTEVPAPMLGVDSNKDQMQKEAKESKESFAQDFDEWICRMERLGAEHAKPAHKVENVSEARAQSAESTTNSDFFQRLLADRR